MDGRSAATARSIGVDSRLMTQSSLARFLHTRSKVSAPSLCAPKLSSLDHVCDQCREMLGQVSIARPAEYTRVLSYTSLRSRSDY